jgi:16S rRNA C967 or C1407 C5-methylase (RsmB/RsmF family)
LLAREQMVAGGSRGLAVEMVERVWEHPSLNGVLSGKFMLQSLPSMLTSHILGPQPGERVLDMCASPGGKTTHIAQLMKNTGLVVAVDRTRSKIDDINRLAAELGLRRPGSPGCIAAQFGDSRKLMATPTSDGISCAHGDHDGGPRYDPESFDRILLDPSCSALGLRPRLRHSASPAELAGYAKLQRLLLRWAVKLLRPGGMLVYSTCTFNPLENERNVCCIATSCARKYECLTHCMLQVAYCLANFPVELQDAAPYYLGSPGLPVSGLADEQRQLVQRFEPGAVEYDCMGFFIAKWAH